MKNKSARIGASALVVAAILGATVLATPANAAPTTQTSSDSASGVLDPATYSGEMEVATPTGGVVVHVEAGQAVQLAQEVREAAAVGEAAKFGTVLPAGVSCGIRVNSVAGPGSYWSSIDGCAVFGYTGYQRAYTWFNTSSVTICASGRGYSSKFVAGWYGSTCLSGGASTTRMAPWGNVLAYTKMNALSVSTVTGAAYQWNS